MDEGDGKVDRILPVASKDEITGFQHLLFTKAKKNLSEEHLWLSVVSRPFQSSFTRLQRLGCCMLLLFTTMIANAMWYGSVDRNETDFAIHFGPVIVSASTLLVSIFGDLTVLPINIAVTQLFKKSRPKGLKYDNEAKAEERKRMRREKTALGQSSSEKTHGEKESGKKKRRMHSKKKWKKKFLTKLKQKYWFPHWCSHLAWLLTIFICVSACFFILCYSLMWGEKKANEWLSSLIISTVQSILLVQPCKVSTSRYSIQVR